MLYGVTSTQGSHSFILGCFFEYFWFAQHDIAPFLVTTKVSRLPGLGRGSAGKVPAL